MMRTRSSRSAERHLSNARPYWSQRWQQAQVDAAAAVATQYDLARTNVRRIQLRGDQDKEWRALHLALTEFNERFIGSATAEPTGRAGEGERALKAAFATVEAVAAQYDLARRYLCRITDEERQEHHWRQLEAVLYRFNQRFTRAR